MHINLRMQLHTHLSNPSCLSFPQDCYYAILKLNPYTSFDRMQKHFVTRALALKERDDCGFYSNLYFVASFTT